LLVARHGMSVGADEKVGTRQFVLPPGRKVMGSRPGRRNAFAMFCRR